LLSSKSNDLQPAAKLSRGEKWKRTMVQMGACRYWLFVPASTSQYWGMIDGTSLGYDIFRTLGDGSPLWIARASTLTDAKEKLDTLVHIIPAEYFARDSRTHSIICRGRPDVYEANASTAEATLRCWGDTNGEERTERAVQRRA
jgi:hypothetical protein